MNARTSRFLLAGLVAPLLLAACHSVVGPAYEAPEAVVPETWHTADEIAIISDPPEDAEWWDALSDPLLDVLIERAFKEGLDLREAYARLREARALRGIAAADRWPSIEAGASYWRSDDSDRTALGDTGGESDFHSATLDASWEIDLWGRVRRAVEASDAELAATTEDVRLVALSLAAETAATYVDLRAFQHRVALAERNVGLQRQTLQLVRARFEAGLVSERDVAQAATNVQVTLSRLPALQIGLRAAENRLSVLLGVAPGSLAAELAAVQPIPVPPVKAAVGTPADIVRKRPDVRAAERRLAAEQARIGVARADLLPRLTLGGSLGVASEDASDLFDNGSGLFGFGPSIRWTLFDGGRLRRRVDVQDARAEQALIRWERAVLLALEESENAMTGFVRGQVRRSALLEAAHQARRAVELARFEYEAGQSDFQVVLDSERALAQLEDELAQADSLIAIQYIALHKALGS